MVNWAFALTLLFIILLVGAGLLFERPIVSQLLTQLNEELRQPIEVESASLSLFRNFPNAAVALHKVRIKAPSDSLLLSAESVQFRFGLLDLLNNAVVFKSIRISDGELHLKVDENGRPNYDIFKPTTAGASSPSSIFLEEALLTNVHLTYNNLQLSQQFSQKVKEARFSGSFAERAFALRANASCFSDSIRFNEKTFLKGLNWGYSAILYVDKVKEKLELSEVSLNIEDSHFNSSGTIEKVERGQRYNLQFSGNNFDLATLLKSISGNFFAGLNDLDCEGKIQLNARVSGLYSNRRLPDISGSIELEHGRLDHPKLYYPIKDASLKATFSNTEINATGPTVFEISHFKGFVNKNPVEVFFRLENIENPYLDIIADGELPLTQLTQLLPNFSFRNPDGTLIFRSVKFSGLASQITDPQKWGSVVMKGELECKDLEFDIKEYECRVPSGYFHFDDTGAELSDLLIKLNDSDISINGSAENLLPVVFADPQNEGVVDFNIKIESNNFNAQNILNAIVSNDPEPENAMNSNTGYEANALVKLGHRLKGHIEAEINNFTYGKIIGQNFNGSLVFADKAMKIKGSAEAMEGHCQVESSIQLTKEPAIVAKILFINIDIKTLFEQGNNLAQDFVRAEHIDGTLNGGALVYGNWDSLLHFDSNKLNILAGVKIDNGYLRNFDLLESFSNYVEVEDLKNVKFATLFNWIEYRNNTFILPAMFVQNNAMNLTVCGSQTASGQIDYNFKINAAQVLSKKFSAKKFRGNLIPAQKDGFINLYINVRGTVDNFEYHLAKSAVKSALKKSEKDRIRIRRILLEAFGQDASLFANSYELLNFEIDEEFPDGDETEYLEGF